MMTAYKYDNGVQLRTANIIYGGSTENQFADTVGFSALTLGKNYMEERCIGKRYSTHHNKRNRTVEINDKENTTLTIHPGFKKKKKKKQYVHNQMFNMLK
jgi:hypothetical protein